MKPDMWELASCLLAGLHGSTSFFSCYLLFLHNFSLCILPMCSAGSEMSTSQLSPSVFHSWMFDQIYAKKKRLREHEMYRNIHVLSLLMMDVRMMGDLLTEIVPRAVISTHCTPTV
ncbi:hypothetical protein AMECASPLE_019726 [Ameca splendens]|uniref:Uncharacterized protein n=1 Tax=Ameca splendens TaxID=208324 RepID=A0ABV0ZZ20_9TELE